LLRVLVMWLTLGLAAASPSSIQLRSRVAGIVVVALLLLSVTGQRQNEASPCIPRQRRPVREIFREMGPYYLKRAYRMDEESFWALHWLLYKDLGGRVKPKKGSTKRHRNGAKNGLIPSPTRLSAALRYYAGGRPDDIAIAHGISHTEVYRCVWRVVNAVNNCPQLKIQFPADHAVQKAIAHCFRKKSKVGIDKCCGAIDGMLVWIEKPYLDECDFAQTGPKKFFCGRKKKFGMNMQAVCDHEGRFLDVCIGHPASTSDYLCFATSPLKTKLDKRGFLADGLCLFGDNAYTNTFYMATPFKNVKSGPKDDYNYFHSSLRIKIECAFGMLVSRWGIMRRPMPAQFGLLKTNALVMSLCRLHNYCINRRLKKTEKPLAVDKAEIVVHGGVQLTVRADGQAVPEEFLRRDEHFDDTSRAHMRQVERQALRALLPNEELPRDLMLKLVVQQDKHRPTPEQWELRGHGGN